MKEHDFNVVSRRGFLKCAASISSLKLDGHGVLRGVRDIRLERV